MAGLVNTNQVCELLHIKERALRNALRKGCPVHHVARKPGERGRPRNMFDIREVQDWFAVNVRGGAHRGRAGVAKAWQSSVETPDVPGVADPLPTDPDTLTAMQRRLEHAERTTYEAWCRALDEYRTGGPDAPSAAAVAIQQKTWQETVERRRKLEKEFPLIMYRRSRYVDVQQAAKIITQGVQAMTVDLDAVGLKVAARCVGKESRDIRREIDDAIRDARRHLQTILADVIGGADG